MTDAIRAVDPIARLAEAWDGRGRHVFLPPFEHRMLLTRAGLDPTLYCVPWNDLAGYQRQALLTACLQGVAFGRGCAWVYGEGEGA